MTGQKDNMLVFASVCFSTSKSHLKFRVTEISWDIHVGDIQWDIRVGKPPIRRSENQLETGLVCNVFRSYGRNKVILGKDPHLCIRDLIKTTYLHPRKSAKGPWRQDNFNVTRQPLKALNLLLGWCICKLCEQKLKLYPLQSDSCFLSMVSSHFIYHTQILHVGNIYLHFPLNVGIFHPT